LTAISKYEENSHKHDLIF